MLFPVESDIPPISIEIPEVAIIEVMAPEQSDIGEMATLWLKFPEWPEF